MPARRRIVAWHNPTLNVVAGLDEHRVVLRLLADRDHQITANRTRTMCGLHALLCLLIEGGTGRALTAPKAAQLLASVHLDGAITVERVAVGTQLLDEIRVLDGARVDVRKRDHGVRDHTHRHPRHRTDRSVIRTKETASTQPAR